jgi:uncharacterized protein YbjQ (UPF0145 family)
VSRPGLRSLLVSMDQGVTPITVVLGACVLQIWQPNSCRYVMTGSGQPLVYPAYEDAIRGAWTTAIGRLEDEARALGAHGVLGTWVSQQWLTAGSMLQVELRGTAVRVEGAPDLARPFLSTLSMESFLELLIGGWVPCGIGWGISAVHVHGWDASPALTGSLFSNREIPVATAGVLLTRERLEAQVRATLAARGAEGGVGMTLQMTRRTLPCLGGEGVLIDGLMLGTGVVRYRPSLAAPHVARDLRKGGNRP